MKKHASIYWAGILAITTTVFSLGMANLALGQAAPPTTAPAATAPSAAPALPTGVSEVVKMYQGGINKEVLVSYVENSLLPFHLNADGIIYLQHLGLPQEVTASMIRRDGDLQKQAMAAYQTQSQNFQQAPAPAPNNQPAAANAAPPVVMPSSPAPVVVNPYPESAPPVVYPDYSGYPYYGYPYYYGPDVFIGGGWGWGFGHGGWGWGHGFDHGGFARGGFSAGHGGFGGGGHGGHR